MDGRPSREAVIAAVQKRHPIGDEGDFRAFGTDRYHVNCDAAKPLAALPSESPSDPERLDVERLARALFAVVVEFPGLLSDADMLNDPREANIVPAAQTIAAEYAALGEEPHDQ